MVLHWLHMVMTYRGRAFGQGRQIYELQRLVPVADRGREDRLDHRGHGVDVRRRAVPGRSFTQLRLRLTRTKRELRDATASQGGGCARNRYFDAVCM